MIEVLESRELAISPDRFEQFANEIIPIMDQLLELSGKYPEMGLFSVSVDKSSKYVFFNKSLSYNRYYGIGRTQYDNNYQAYIWNGKKFLFEKEITPATDQSARGETAH